jgi:uncharacterized short protein YbdD (DUF466 family)
MKSRAPASPLDSSPSSQGADLSELEAFRAERRDKGLRWAVVNTTWRLVWVAWNFLRQASGDDAYERYLDHMVRAHPGQPAMSRGEYYRFRTEQKWNRITRCC